MLLAVDCNDDDQHYRPLLVLLSGWGVSVVGPRSLAERRTRRMEWYRIDHQGSVQLPTGRDGDAPVCSTTVRRRRPQSENSSRCLLSGSLHGREEKQVRLSMCGGVMTLRTTSRRTQTLTSATNGNGNNGPRSSIRHGVLLLYKLPLLMDCKKFRK